MRALDPDGFQVLVAHDDEGAVADLLAFDLLVRFDNLLGSDIDELTFDPVHGFPIEGMETDPL